MTTVVYQVQIPYLWHANGGRYPGLIVQVQNPSYSANVVEIVAELDSGAEYSLFNGKLAKAIGLDLADGEEFRFEATNRSSINAIILRAIIYHPDLGSFPMDLRFSTDDIRRNLLGRDFFNQMQLGFREHHMEVYVTPVP
ncbi:MAG TPA: hypothetical protein VIX59_05855 [Candidatus Binataceae bacterium]